MAFSPIANSTVCTFDLFEIARVTKYGNWIFFRIVSQRRVPGAILLHNFRRSHSIDDMCQQRRK